jgi:hypothetical protein
MAPGAPWRVGFGVERRLSSRPVYISPTRVLVISGGGRLGQRLQFRRALGAHRKETNNNVVVAGSGIIVAVNVAGTLA